MNKISMFDTMIIWKKNNLTLEEYYSMVLSNPEKIDTNINFFCGVVLLVIIGKNIMDILK